MKNIQIKTEEFFELLKLQDTSMWDIFEKMIDGEEKQIVFLDKDEKVVTTYILPQTLDQLKEDKEIFSKTFAEKLSHN
ncbi:hypothetical protein ATB99_13910 [Elizabethkingia meningoseptica]|uniref:hypothetical protein n=1 Tax=Elizabethkingia meningoseptica TaxID=238 RepID=UPI000332C327|nr:hypothetical protein [Elizabethkingia meningoseptica]AQX06539.1 hypothetical protein BBD33_15305 [Elizabethkingia meningoseptica]AQX48585.1 hypothetical protein B5G46_15300 [Elizabethkingia meningoseptica]EOR29598.1 hypothetical protein L100_10559 [Elizabethkingia meningoseptica ATCC 13253 = NBRC 12535]KUY13639.1 hypothetical protein ATB99_13910 [Elizabethkingia meningoseptica]OPB75536.1 hypothetical protein BAY30_00260 [Elizabethkingia meningoseptica]